jgi:hypothetical protein
MLRGDMLSFVEPRSAQCRHLYKLLKVVRVFNIGTKEVYSLTISLLYRLSQYKAKGVSTTFINKRN